MGNNLFGANISGQLASIMGPLLGSKAKATLHKRAGSGHNTSDPSAGTGLASGTGTPYACIAIIEPKRKLLPASRVAVGDSIISILGDTIAGGTIVPDANDSITLNGKTYLINAVASDPDLAMYECSCRG